MFHFPHRPAAVRVAKIDSTQTVLGRLQAHHARRIGRSILLRIQGLGLKIDQQALASALEQNDIEAIFRLLDIESLVTAVEDVSAVVTELTIAGAEVGLQDLPQSVVSAMPRAPEIVSPFIQPFIESRGAELVRLVTNSQRKAIQDIIAEGFRSSRLLSEMATDITQTVGLLPNHATAVQRFRSALLERGVSPARATKTAQGYANRLLRVRANNIARTESMNALAAGQQESWEVAERENLIGIETETFREWTVFRPCPNICAPIPGRGPVGLREPFITGQGVAVLSPPAHPSCRCVVNLLIKDRGT